MSNWCHELQLHDVTVCALRRMTYGLENTVRDSTDLNWLDAAVTPKSAVVRLAMKVTKKRMEIANDHKTHRTHRERLIMSMALKHTIAKTRTNPKGSLPTHNLHGRYYYVSQRHPLSTIPTSGNHAARLCVQTRQ